MKKLTNQKATEPKKLAAQFDADSKTWVVEISRGRYRVFVTEEEAEGYCVKKSRVPVKAVVYHQELPKSSVFTGKPWDHNFKHLY